MDMQRFASLELPSCPGSAKRARQFVEEHCRGWALGELCGDVILPVSEVVTNAVLHASAPITVTVMAEDACITVSVRDSEPRPPVLRPVRLDVAADIDIAARRSDELPEDLRDFRLHVGDAGSIAAGRGLHIVAAVADEWGTSQLHDGKEVWFRIHTPAGRPL